MPRRVRRISLSGTAPVIYLPRKFMNLVGKEYELEVVDDKTFLIRILDQSNREEVPLTMVYQKVLELKSLVEKMLAKGGGGHGGGSGGLDKASAEEV